MKNYNTDSSANVSRFARDKRQRINTTERVERSPRPRREADNEGQREYRPRTTSAPTQRRSFNPHFTDENRLRSEYTPREERQERGSRYERTERFERSERGDRYERNDRTERSERGGFKPKSEGYRAKSARPATSSKPAFRGEGKPAYKSEGKPAYKSEGKGGAKRSFSSKRDEKPRNYPKYNPNKVTGEVRLNRFISQSGVCSRREADDFILAGVVTVNGQVVTELGTKILPTDEVRFNDERLQGEKNVYLVLNKPKGYVTSLDDPYADKTVMDLVKNACTERVYPVGRLDKNSVGLLLITNDGDITRQLTHPSCHKKKIYQVTLDKPLTRADMETLTEGITLEDGDIFADEIAYASEDKRSVGVEIHSGRNRIVRRMFEHLGYTVQKLDRVYYAGLTKKNLKRGAWRFLTKEEVMRLKTGQYE
ncbi:MAG: pseudouridine synthase [Alistipes sp.]|nr:pseudouridine synthase [Alistipes sp.]MBR6632065.1 pseudouridine synthase [Alistipes sp.]